ncbi:DUF3152 domain-containing protein, partial [Streptomyces sp. JJ36]|uniref:DUF3152 domain-containing protein n=1 Tax=Streptomyces sp. JJ36 TaxID=2736645 RepID=UPI001F158E3E
APRPDGGAPRSPQARGGHPEHREPGGGWGRTGTERGPAPPGPGSPPAQGAPAGRIPGPRQEYLDAFDAPGDDVFAAGAPGRAPAGDPAARPGSVPPGAGVPGRRQPPPEEGPAGGGPAADEDDGARPRPERHSKGRTFTGVAAAAVTTVLAVVVAGQVTGDDHGRATRATGPEAGTDRPEEAGQRDGASRSRPRSTAPEPQAQPLTYAEKMSAVVPLDPELSGPGSFRAVGGRAEGAGDGRVLRYRVDVEDDLPLDAELFAEAVHTTLNDRRSWAHGGERSFERVASGEADFVITLASPGTTGVWCAKSGLDTTVQNVSCDSAATERIMINAYRWAQGSRTFGDDRIRQYREMLINHEVGHRLGRGHLLCPEDGALAPVMMQQTKTLTSGAATCRPNAWPYPSP